MAESTGDRRVDDGWAGRPAATTTGRSSAGPSEATGGSTDATPAAGAGSGVVNTSPSGASFWSKARAVAIAALIGVPAFAFLVVITWGAILMPLSGLLLLAPFVAVNYLLWGRLLAPGKPPDGRRRVHDEVA